MLLEKLTEVEAMEVRVKQSKEEKQFNKLIDKLVKEQKKSNYHNLETLDFLKFKSSSLLFDISTRGDGKTFNYLYALIRLALEIPSFKFVVIRRSFSNRMSIVNEIESVIQNLEYV
jgi:hypothetical protein